jgi:hypothetical protein
LAQVTLTDFLKNLYAADDKTRLTIANDLKKAGFLEGCGVSVAKTCSAPGARPHGTLAIAASSAETGWALGLH